MENNTIVGSGHVGSTNELLSQSFLPSTAILNSLPVAVYICNTDGQIVYFNEKAVQLWGHRPSHKETSARFWTHYKMRTIDGFPLSSDQTPTAVALQSGIACHDVEVQVERQDGSRFYASISVDLIKDVDGIVAGAINVLQDITKQKQVEKASLEKERFYRDAIKGLPAAIYTTDREGILTMYNEAAVQLWGRRPKIGEEKWCGSWKIFTPDGTAVSLDTCPMAISIKEQKPILGRELVVQRPDGSVRDISVYPQPLFNESGEMIGAINMLIDITEIKRSEKALKESESDLRELAASLEKTVEEKTFDLKKKNEELRKSEERYHKMVDEVEDYAIILLDKNGIIQNWNKGAEKIKGYKDEEIVGKSFEIFYRDEDRESRLPCRLINEAIEKGKAIHEGWRVRKNGTFSWGSIVLTALHDDENAIIGFSKVTRDLTERKMAEDRMKAYNQQLEAQNRELEQFAYAASHDMKEPLRKISFYSSHLWKNLSDNLSEKDKDYLKRSINAAERMQSLIDNLLEFSKASLIVDGFDTIDLNEIISEVIAFNKESIEQQDATFTCDVLPTIGGIHFQMRQLFDNLISNALKYRHKDRKPTLSISSRTIDGNKVEGLDPQRLYYQISFSDNGIGFEPVYAEKIFDLFTRLDPAHHSGTGIGLALCKKIVQNHGGTIIAEGVADQGAKFHVYLPA